MPKKITSNFPNQTLIIPGWSIVKSWPSPWSDIHKSTGVLTHVKFLQKFCNSHTTNCRDRASRKGNVPGKIEFFLNWSVWTSTNVLSTCLFWTTYRVTWLWSGSTDDAYSVRLITYIYKGCLRLYVHLFHIDLGLLWWLHNTLLTETPAITRLNETQQIS